MKKHTGIYLDEMGFDEADYIPCEMCNARAVDVHHIDCKGMGGSKEKDYIENLMALCRTCHVSFGDKKQFKEILQKVHSLVMDENKVETQIKL